MNEIEILRHGLNVVLGRLPRNDHVIVAGQATISIFIHAVQPYDEFINALFSPFIILGTLGRPRDVPCEGKLLKSSRQLCQSHPLPW